MKAYQHGEHAILARPMTNIDYHMQQDECEYEDLEGMEVETGYFIIFERDCKELTP